MNGVSIERPDMTRDEKLRALQADVNAWAQRVKEAGVTKIDGSAYVPVARNNAILRTPDDPEATLAYMIETWQSDDAATGSDGWYRIIAQAGPDLTWEWLMVDQSKVYADLFPAELRDRVSRALEADAGYKAWTDQQERDKATNEAASERVEQLRERMRAGRERRPALPELDDALRGRPQ